MKVIIRKFSVVMLAAVMLLSMSVPAFATGTIVKITDMHETASENVSFFREADDYTISSYGDEYRGYFIRIDNDGWITYELKGEYDSFNGTLIASEKTDSSAYMNFAIYADGKMVYEYKGFTRQIAAQNVSLDLNGVNRLEIKSTKEGYDAYIYLVDSTFTKADIAAVTYPEWVHLNDLKLIDSKEYASSNYNGMDSYGNFHDTWNRFYARAGGFALYNLNKEYEIFSGVVCASDKTHQNSSMEIQIYTDDILVWSKSGVTRDTAPIQFEVDVSNAGTLRVVTSDANNQYDSYIYVENSIVSKHTHTIGNETVSKEPTCTELGEKSWICTVCKEVVKTEKIPSLGHKPDGKSIVIKEATCTEPGEEAQHCTACGEPVDVKTIAALGHNPDGKWMVTKEATCVEEGEEVQYCTVCGEVAESRHIEKTDHTPSKDWETVREATCAEEGLRQKTCTVCGKVAEEEVIEKINHKFGSWTTLSGSVWNNPIIKERTCSVCGEVEHVESNSTSWLKPLVIVLSLIVFGGLVVILVTLKMNGLPLEPASVKKLFSKETLSDTDIENLLNKKDDMEHKK